MFNVMKRRMIAAALAAVLLICAAPHARAASSDEIREQLAALEKEEDAIAQERERLAGQYAENRQELEQIVAEKYAIDRQIALLQEQTGNINDQIAAYSLLIADGQEKLDAARQRYDTLAEQNRDRIRTMEEQGTLNYWSVLFHAGSFSDLLDRMNMIQEIQKADERRMEELAAAAQEVERAQRLLMQDKASMEQARQSLMETQTQLDEKRQEADELVLKLWEKGEEYRRFLLEAEEEQDNLMQQIADKEAELEEAEYLEWLASLPPKQEEPDDDPEPPVSSGGWVSPLRSYSVTSAFGMRLHPVHKVWKMHNGVDMSANKGTPIYAARSGKVTAASSHWSMGEYVSVNHGDGYASIYMHMDYFIVSAGDYVTAGQIIGYVGDSGVTTAAHLHFGISYKGEYVNPMEYI